MVDTGPAIALTVVLGALAVTAWWLFSRRTAASPGEPRWAELDHLVMSIAMIVMVWWPTGLLGTVIQAVVFAIFALAWIRRILRSTTLGGRLGAGAHLIMDLAMVWMLLIMVLPGGHTATGSGGEGHAGHDHHGGGEMSMAAAGDPSPAIGMITDVSVVVLAVAVVWWVVAAARRHDHRLEAVCHALMAGAMAAMLTLMH